MNGQWLEDRTDARTRQHPGPGNHTFGLNTQAAGEPFWPGHQARLAGWLDQSNSARYLVRLVAGWRKAIRQFTLRREGRGKPALDDLGAALRGRAAIRPSSVGQ